MQSIKPIPIGVEFYKQMINEGYYYIDKTLLIRDLLLHKNTVTLFTRPRRFGKTLAQSMLKTFFEMEILPDGTMADNSVYFQGKKIMESGEEYIKHMGQYPVIFLSLKSAKQPVYEMAYESLAYEIRKEYDRHRYILESDSITEEDKQIYHSVLTMEAGSAAFARAIAFLSECLEKYHKQKVIILIDEYDVPLENAYFKAFNGDVDPMIVSKNRYPCHVFLDANFSVQTKQAMIALCERRGDCTLYLDCGLDIRTMRSPITFVKNNLDSYARNRNECIMGIAGKIRDPYSKKITTVTITYALAYRLPIHWNEYGGRHVPFAGNTYGIIDDDFIIDSIYPLYDDGLHSELMDEMAEERINYARINAKQRTVISTQTSRQVKSSNLSEMNNVQILLDIKRACEEMCAEYQYNFSETEDIIRFNRDAETILGDFEDAQVRSITASFDKNDWEAERGILHLYVELIHKDLVKTSIIEIDVNRGSTSTSNE